MADMYKEFIRGLIDCSESIKSLNKLSKEKDAIKLKSVHNSRAKLMMDVKKYILSDECMSRKVLYSKGYVEAEEYTLLEDRLYSSVGTLFIKDENDCIYTSRDSISKRLSNISADASSDVMLSCASKSLIVNLCKELGKMLDSVT